MPSSTLERRDLALEEGAEPVRVQLERFYGDEGAPHLLFVHGWGSGRAVWFDLVRQLSPRYHCHLLDLPGYGLNHHLGGALTLEKTLQLLWSVAPQGGIWIGWSLGGTLLLAAALAAEGGGEPPRGVVTIASTPRFTVNDGWSHGIERALLEQFAQELIADCRQTLLRFFALQSLGSSAGKRELRQLKALVQQREEPHPAALAAGLEWLQQIDLRRKLARLTVPLLQLHGERDRLVPRSAAETTRQLLPGSKLEIITGAGHAPFLSHPQQFLRQLEPWLESTTGT
ncbi:MAG: pimeloyl-ACP methyl ester esterase BioH [Gammaproteobacteria bacterium]|nr:pimeloyl-ACP methyl ester esterase BioH [Gammaproteobacteria bacterium]